MSVAERTPPPAPADAEHSVSTRRSRRGLAAMVAVCIGAVAALVLGLIWLTGDADDTETAAPSGVDAVSTESEATSTAADPALNGPTVVKEPTVRTAAIELPAERLPETTEAAVDVVDTSDAAQDQADAADPTDGVETDQGVDPGEPAPDADATTQPAAPIEPPADPAAAEPIVTVGAISIPKLGLDQTLYSGIRLSTLDRGPGHWPGTALPGDVGNVVVAAHRTSHGAPFRHIDTLVAGDEVRFATDAGDFVYRVISTEVVQPDAMWIVDPTPTATATLFACHPPGSVSQRIVVHLELAA